MNGPRRSNGLPVLIENSRDVGSEVAKSIPIVQVAMAFLFDVRSTKGTGTAMCFILGRLSRRNLLALAQF